MTLTTACATPPATAKFLPSVEASLTPAGSVSYTHIDVYKRQVYLRCQSGSRSQIASRILEGNGYETYNFSGGFRFYDAVVNDRALIERAYACGCLLYTSRCV